MNSNTRGSDGRVSDTETGNEATGVPPTQLLARNIDRIQGSRLLLLGVLPVALLWRTR